MLLCKQWSTRLRLAWAPPTDALAAACIPGRGSRWPSEGADALACVAALSRRGVLAASRAHALRGLFESTNARRHRDQKPCRINAVSRNCRTMQLL